MNTLGDGLMKGGAENKRLHGQWAYLPQAKFVFQEKQKVSISKKNKDRGRISVKKSEVAVHEDTGRGILYWLVKGY